MSVPSSPPAATSAASYAATPAATAPVTSAARSTHRRARRPTDRTLQRVPRSGRHDGEAACRCPETGTGPCYKGAMASDEVLVIGYAPGDDAPRRVVVARAGADVVVLRGGEADLAEVGRHARLALARTPDGGTRSVGDDAAIEALDEASQLFVAAWKQRPTAKPDRIGEGKAWDAPGFEPPDLPG